MADAIKVHVYDDATLLASVAVSGGNWSKTGQTLAAGSHKIKGKSEDLAGNIGSFSTIKNIKTGATETPTCDLLDDSGESSTDNVTNDSTPRIKVSLTLTPPTGCSTISENTVKTLMLLKWDGDQYEQYLSESSNISWDESCTFSFDFQVVTALGEGEHKFKARWIDQKNNSSALGTELSITVDTTAPNAPSITNIQDGQVFIGTSIDISGTAS